MRKTWLQTELGVQIPIVSAPMGGRANGALASAVTSAGGLGMISADNAGGADWLAAEGKIAGAAGAFGIGHAVWGLAGHENMLDLSISLAPKLITLSFGDPAPYVQRVRDAGILVGSAVNNAEDLRIVLDAGVDFVVVQGGEAGGHTGRMATLPLLQQVLEGTDLPVIAAGGIGTGRGLAAVLAAGAEGAMIGTALLASPETFGPEFAIEKLVGADGAETVYTAVFDRAQKVPWPDRWHGRAIVNAFTERWHDAADTDGMGAAYDPKDPELGVVYAGEISGVITESRPAAQVVRSIWADAQAQIARLAG